MKLEYNVKPVLVKRIYIVTHKGKRRNFQSGLHVHDAGAHELIYVDYGNVRLLIEEKVIDIAPGHCIIIPGGSTHWFTGKEGAPFDYLNILFHGEIPQSLFSKSIPVHRENYELMDRLKKESVHELPYCREVIASYLTLLLANLIRQTDIAVPNKLPGFANSQRYQSQSVTRAMTIIANKYASPLDMKQLSRSVGISESYLCALIKRETGESCTKILQKQRVSAAKHLLRESVHSFEEISSAVGYDSVSFFFKIFKRITGMTPKTYSNSLGEPTELSIPGK